MRKNRLFVTEELSGGRLESLDCYGSGRVDVTRIH